MGHANPGAGRRMDAGRDSPLRRPEARGPRPGRGFPDAAFRRLAGQLRPCPKRGRGVGSEEKARLSGEVGVKTAGIELSSTHGIDALVSAVLARMALTGTAIPTSCGHDRSAIWIPKAPVTGIPEQPLSRCVNACSDADGRLNHRAELDEPTTCDHPSFVRTG